MAYARSIARSGELSTPARRLSYTVRGAVAALALVSAAGCAGEAANPANTLPPTGHSSPSAKAPSTGAPAAARETACHLPGSALEVAKRYSGSVALSPLVGTSVRLGAHDCYDSFVIELGGTSPAQLPGVHARYITGPVKAEPADRPVTVRGKEYLQITVGAAMYATGGGPGPSHIDSASVAGIEEAVLTENFEGQSTWTLGLEQQRPFTVSDVAGTANCPTECIVVNLQAAH